MAYVTKNFSLAEIQHSDTAERRGIINVVPIDAYGVMNKLFGEIMQPLRDFVGPIKVNSGYRCKELNDKIGGSPFSQHIYSNQRGAACDFVHANGEFTTPELINCILHLRLEFDQLILEYPRSHTGGWLHVSTCGANSENRFQILVKEAKKPYNIIDVENNDWGIFIEEGE